MRFRYIVWTPIVIEKLKAFRSERFTPFETLDFISQVVLETEDLLKTIQVQFTDSIIKKWGLFLNPLIKNQAQVGLLHRW